MELDCGIRQERITAWLDEELSLVREDASWLFSNGAATCRIATCVLPSRALGNLDLERTLVSVEGDPVAIDSFYRLFTLRFISAGG